MANLQIQDLPASSGLAISDIFATQKITDATLKATMQQLLTFVHAKTAFNNLQNTPPLTNSILSGDGTDSNYTLFEFNNADTINPVLEVRNESVANEVRYNGIRYYTDHANTGGVLHIEANFGDAGAIFSTRSATADCKLFLGYLQNGVFDTGTRQAWEINYIGSTQAFEVSSYLNGVLAPRFRINHSTGLLSVTTANYENLVTADDDIPNKKWVVDNSGSSWNRVGTVLSPLTITDQLAIGITTSTEEVQIHNPASIAQPCLMQLTNITTGSSAGDGLRVGVSATGRGLFISENRIDFQIGNPGVFVGAVLSNGNLNWSNDINITTGNEYQINGASINTSSTLSNIAYLDTDNIYSSNTFRSWNAYYNSGFKVLAGGNHGLALKFDGSNNNLQYWISETTTVDDPLSLIYQFKNGGGEARFVTERTEPSDVVTHELSVPSTGTAFHFYNIGGGVSGQIRCASSGIGIGRAGDEFTNNEVFLIDTTLRGINRLKFTSQNITTGTYNALDSSTYNVFRGDTSGGNITINGIDNGVFGMVVYLYKNNANNTLQLSHNDTSGAAYGDRILTSTGANETSTNYGVVTLIYNGSYWVASPLQ